MRLASVPWEREHRQGSGCESGCARAERVWERYSVRAPGIPSYFVAAAVGVWTAFVGPCKYPSGCLGTHPGTWTQGFTLPIEGQERRKDRLGSGHGREMAPLGFWKEGGVRGPGGRCGWTQQ